MQKWTSLDFLFGTKGAEGGAFFRFETGAEGGAFLLFEAEGEEGGGDFLVDGLGMVGKGATVSFA